jgi:sugar/nucleoside kinase (ribokinase family)
MKRVHCLGVLVVDALSGPLRHYPIPGRITQVNTETIRFMSGGGAANTASALCQMGIPAAVFSKLGDDPNGVFLLRELEAHGVDTRGICVSKTDTTPFTFVGVHPDGERTFIHTPGANRTFSLADIDRQALLNADYLLYDDLWVMPRLDGKPGAGLLEEAQTQGIVTLLDECWGLGPSRESFETMVPHAEYVLPSYHDLSAIYPGKTPEEIIAILHQLGAKKVVLKMGKAGCLLSCGGAVQAIASVATRVLDTTGAGDSFVAGFIAGLVRGCTDRESAVIGSRTAAVCIQHVGGAVGIPSFETLREGLPQGEDRS